MIVLDVWLGPTHQNRGRQNSWSECLSRFCSGQIQPPEKQSQPVVGRKSSTFPFRLWTKTCMRMMMDPLTMRKNWSMFAFIASKSALAWRWKFRKWEWRKRIPHQFKRWQVWLWGWCKSGRSSHVASTILAEIRFKRSRGGKKRSKGYRGKKICHLFSTRLDKADVPKVGAKDQSVNVRLRCKTGT